MKRLTQAYVNSLKPQASTYLVCDCAVPGFGVRVLPTGCATYVFRYKDGSKQKQISIGRASAMDADTARAIATDFYIAKQQGNDPKPTVPVGASTVADLIQHFLDATAKRRTCETQEQYQRVLRQHIAPAMGSEHVADPQLAVTIARAHDRMADTPAAANLMRKVLASAFRWAVPLGYAPHNPVRDLPRHKEEGKHAAMTLDEVRRVWLACERFTALTHRRWHKLGHAFQLLIVLGCRKREIFDLRWGDITGDMIRLTADRTKTDEAYTIYLSDIARAVLDQVEREDKHVFGVDGKTIANGEDWHIWQDILDLAGLPGKAYRIHDIRHTFATLAGHDGTLDMKAISLLLNHQRVATTERYFHGMEAARLRASKLMGANLNSILQAAE